LALLQNPPKRGGKEDKLMDNKKSFVQAVALLAFITLTGWSCSPGYGVSNVEDTTPTAQIYRSDEWGVSFQYPAGWQYREYREMIEGEEEITLAFSDTPLPETLPPEPIFPVMVFRDSRTVDEVAAIHADAISIENSTLGGRIIKVVTRYSDILEANYSIYLVPLQVGSIHFLPLDARYISVAESMISTLSETE